MVKIQFLGHSFFKISFPDAKVLIDPFIHNTHPEKEKQYERVLPCSTNVDKIKNIDMILISNEMFDHFEKNAIETIAKRDNALVIAHDSILNELSLPRQLLRSINVGQKTAMKNIEITATTAHYPASFYPLGFLLANNGTKVFFAGATDLIDDFSEIKSDVALLPIGGSITMDVVDGVKATKVMKPRYVIPMHYNTFDFIKADAKEFKAKIEKSNLATIPIILEPGQEFEIK
ncbi:MAG: MBL fold metallo-hydrolase [archaeon]|nr:MBL fold metallo-hydrolase [archaeon]